MDFNEFVLWGFCGIVSSGLFFLVMLLHRLVASINRLNIKIAEILGQIAGHEIRITTLERE